MYNNKISEVKINFYIEINDESGGENNIKFYTYEKSIKMSLIDFNIELIKKNLSITNKELLDIINDIKNNKAKIENFKELEQTIQEIIIDYTNDNIIPFYDDELCCLDFTIEFN